MCLRLIAEIDARSVGARQPSFCTFFQNINISHIGGARYDQKLVVDWLQAYNIRKLLKLFLFFFFIHLCLKKNYTLFTFAITFLFVNQFSQFLAVTCLRKFATERILHFSPHLICVLLLYLVTRAASLTNVHSCCNEFLRTPLLQTF